MAVIDNGELAWAKAYGLADNGTGALATVSTIFRACSLSKVVSAYGALRFLQERGISLDAPLSEILPHPTVEHPRVSEITTRTILSHSSGLSHTLRNPKMEFSPGERWGYSSGGFAYLQMVIEHLSGKTFAQFAREWVLEPIEMESSDFAWKEEWENIAASHDEDGKPLEDDRPGEEGATSGGSLSSTPTDICKFLSGVLRDEEILGTMMEEVIPVQGNLAWGNGWGLEKNDPEGGLWGWQWGWSRTGFRNYMAVHPDSGKGIVIFTNGTRGYALWKPIATEVVGGQHGAIDWVLRDL